MDQACHRGKFYSPAPGTVPLSPALPPLLPPWLWSFDRHLATSHSGTRTNLPCALRPAENSEAGNRLQKPKTLPPPRGLAPRAPREPRARSHPARAARAPQCCAARADAAGRRGPRRGFPGHRQPPRRLPTTSLQRKWLRRQLALSLQRHTSIACVGTPFSQMAAATCRLVSVFIYLKPVWLQNVYFLFDPRADSNKGHL